MEVLVNLVSKKRFINRGFLMGPYCPIYGFGCLFLITLLSKYSNEVPALFALAIIICSIVEYFTSWIMEKLFKLRWWDYSKKKYNINGRICLETMIPFGIIGTLVVKYVNPYMLNLINKVPDIVLNNIAIILLTILIIDIVISTNIILNFENIVKDSKKDSTEEIKKFIRKKIRNNKYLYNRLANSFPNFSKSKRKEKSKKKSK